MKGDIKTFEADLAKMAEHLNRSVADVKRYIALDFYNTVTEPPHPVKTGYARANWRISATTPDTTVSAKPTGDNVMAIPSPDVSALREADVKDPIFVTNSVSYIGFLEEGTSKMAPRHFIKRALQVVQSRTQDYIRRAEQANR